MNKKWKKKWIKALLSGEYTQGYGYLKTLDNKYCCLGVLCDIVAPNEWNICNRHMGQGCTPDHIITEKVILPFHARSTLVTLNDEKRHSFQEIANWIDKHL